MPHILQGPDGMILPRWDGSAHIGVTMEQTSFDARRTVEGLAQIYHAVQPWTPWLKSAAFKTSWAGLRPMTPDRGPLIGAVLVFEGLVAATGHSSVGIFLAPLTARLVVDAVEGKASLLSHPGSMPRTGLWALNRLMGRQPPHHEVNHRIGGLFRAGENTGAVGVARKPNV